MQVLVLVARTGTGIVNNYTLSQVICYEGESEVCSWDTFPIWTGESPFRLGLKAQFSVVHPLEGFWWAPVAVIKSLIMKTLQLLWCIKKITWQALVQPQWFSVSSKTK
jgi:hypothetical protein